MAIQLPQLTMRRSVSFDFKTVDILLSFFHQQPPPIQELTLEPSTLQSSPSHTTVNNLIKTHPHTSSSSSNFHRKSQNLSDAQRFKTKKRNKKLSKISRKSFLLEAHEELLSWFFQLALFFLNKSIWKSENFSIKKLTPCSGCHDNAKIFLVFGFRFRLKKFCF